VIAGGCFFVYGVFYGRVKSLKAFRKWTAWSALVAAILVLFAALPIDRLFPSSAFRDDLKDIGVVANSLGPLLLSVSIALASIFYSAGEWYDHFQKFRALGITDAREDRQGRQAERSMHWQRVLSDTKIRFVVSGVTLGGWFDAGFQDTRDNFLTIARFATIDVLLAHPNEAGFNARADDPAEEKEAALTENARDRAQRGNCSPPCKRIARLVQADLVARGAAAA
jgi:hypothetical protein